MLLYVFMCVFGEGKITSSESRDTAMKKHMGSNGTCTVQLAPQEVGGKSTVTVDGTAGVLTHFYLLGLSKISWTN